LDRARIDELHDVVVGAEIVTKPRRGRRTTGRAGGPSPPTRSAT